MSTFHLNHPSAYHIIAVAGSTHPHDFLSNLHFIDFLFSTSTWFVSACQFIHQMTSYHSQASGFSTAALDYQLCFDGFIFSSLFLARIDCLSCHLGHPWPFDAQY